MGRMIKQAIVRRRMTEPAMEDPTAPLLLYAVKQVELLIRVHLEELLKDAEVTALQYTALTELDRVGELSAADLARRSFVTAQSMADLVAALTRKQLITRSPDPHDRKRLLISLTDKGRQLVEDARQPVAELDRRMTGSLTPSQRDALRQALTECRLALQHMPLGG